MSDTPITDKEAYDYTTGERCLDGVVSADVARKLERENAALSLSVTNKANAIRKLELENAALREDKDTLIKCIELALIVLDEKQNQAAVLTLNVALDAARKEQP